MTSIISNDISKNVLASVSTLKALQVAEASQRECAVLAVKAGLVVFPIGMSYAAFTVARDAWKVAYGSTTVGNDHAFSRLMGEMKAGAEWKAPKSDNASAIAKAKAKAKPNAKIDAAKALLEKAKADEKAENAKLKEQRDSLAKAIKTATQAQLDAIAKILK